MKNPKNVYLPMYFIYANSHLYVEGKVPVLTNKSINFQGENSDVRQTKIVVFAGIYKSSLYHLGRF